MCNCLTADKEEDSEEDGEVEYQHIPLDERLPSDLAAPCLQHLLSGGKASTSTPTPPQEPKAEKQKVEKPVAKKKPVTKSPVESDDDDESKEEQAKQI